MTRAPRSPLEGVDRLIVDANNLLHAGRGAAPLPAASLIGRLRGAIPGSVGIELIFDGAPDPGLRGERIASGLIVRHAGRRSADEVIVSLVAEARSNGGPLGADNVLVVTDDRELRAAVQHAGAKTARAAWLLGRLARGTLEAPTTGNRRPPKPPRATEPAAAIRSDGESTDPDGATRDADTADGDDEPPRWQPGRRATVKRGNPHRGRGTPGRGTRGRGAPGGGMPCRPRGPGPPRSGRR